MHQNKIAKRATGLALVALLLLATIDAQAASAERGRTFARVHCAQCHSLDQYSPSPLKDAPPFRDLQERYPVESLEEALGEGIVTGHPSMPEFRLEPDQIGDFIAFLKTFECKAPGSGQPRRRVC